jgi:hydrogenase maturation protein HypF
VDDSVARILLGREQVLRRARGYAPLPIRLKRELPDLLAVGPHLKNTVTVSRGTDVFLSQHIGDLETAQSHQAFNLASESLQSLYRIRPVAVVSDLHPDYLSTRYARSLGLPVVAIQHHVAHVASCMGENDLEPPVLGVSWDGTGYGTDGTIWGGEFILVADGNARRYATLRPFLLPGGDSAVKEPRRSAVGLLFAMMGPEGFLREDLPSLRAFQRSEVRILETMLRRRVNSPVCTSVGRLFDAVASLIDLRQRCTFEGQAAMELEFAAESGLPADPYPFHLEQTGSAGTPQPAEVTILVDWRPMVSAILEDLVRGTAHGIIAARFHLTLVDIIAAIARRAGIPRVVLTGGCFQNRILSETSVRRLEQEGFRPCWHQRVPPNDGGVAFGQIMAASYLNLLR